MPTELSATNSMFANRCAAGPAQAKLPGTGKATTISAPSAEKPAPPAGIDQAIKTDNAPDTANRSPGKVALQDFRQALVKMTSAQSRQYGTTAAGRRKGGQRQCGKNGPDLSASVLLSMLLGNPAAMTEAQPSTKTALNLSNTVQTKNGPIGPGSKEAEAKTATDPILSPNHCSNAQVAAQNTRTQAVISTDTQHKTKPPGKASARQSNDASVQAYLNKETGKETKQVPGLQRQVTEAGTKALKTAKTFPHIQKVAALHGNQDRPQAGQGENKHKSPLNEGKMGLDARKPASHRIADKLVFSESLGRKTQAGVHLSGSSSAKPDIIQAQVSAGQAKSLKDSAPKNASPTQPDQVPASGNTQMSAPEQPLVTAQAVKNPDSASSPDAARSISQQIAESVQISLRQADKQVTIHLYPPELGRVYMRFQEQEDQIIGLLEVSKAETRFEIEQQLPQIIRSLHDAGVEIRKFEVVLSDQPERHADSNQSLEEDPPQQHASSRQNNQGHESAGEWLTGKATDGQQSNSEPQTEVTDGRVNVLI